MQLLCRPLGSDVPACGRCDVCDPSRAQGNLDRAEKTRQSTARRFHVDVTEEHNNRSAHSEHHRPSASPLTARMGDY